MNKILPVFLCAVFLSFCNVKAANYTQQNILEEIILDTEETQEIRVEENRMPEDSLNEQISLKEKLKNVYNLNIEKYDEPRYLLEEVLKHKYSEKSKLDYTKFWGGYNGNIGVKFIENNDTGVSYNMNALNVGFDGAFKNDNADFRIMLSFPQHSNRNFFDTLFADLYVATNKVPHHRFMAGHMRAPVGKEGGSSTYTLPYFTRAQIARNFGTARKIGIRAIGEYSLVDYDIGAYSSDTYFREFFPGMEFAGWVNIKPLGKTDGKYGKLKIGGGLEAGHRGDDYCVTGAYLEYEYKKLTANFEWANANGYNGLKGNMVNNHASGFYTTVGYMITKKLQVLARYDEFDPDRHKKHNNNREYTLGFNYFIKGQALRLILNYIFCENNIGKNSHRILIGTQILL